ncbi:WecB/TagA/CpsF family glycosyltransferase [Nitrosomonas sp.]|uniref:WecB/TagA/CpsF family glycosyltransferase n=1 Tax=Nitrosomonas sp. TaxID=42353 RepID=UPI0037CB0320
MLDTQVDCVNMTDALKFVEEHIRTASRVGTILAVNPEKIYALRQSSFLRDFFTRAALLIPDGIGIVFATRMNGYRVERVAGADLMQQICTLAEQKGYRIFIYGAKEEVNRDAVERLRERHSLIKIVGRANGYVKDESMDALVSEINESKAEILFVALGSPRQEQWMAKHLDLLTTVKICQGIGGTLDTIVGTVKRAPLFMQRLNLEWFYRLLQQPSRAGRQIKLLRFAWETSVDRLRSLTLNSRK